MSRITRKIKAYKSDNLSTGELARLFNKFWGLGNQHLPIYPEIIGQVQASWFDSSGQKNYAKHLDELIYAYENGIASVFEISGSVNNGPHTAFAYVPQTKQGGISVTANEPVVDDFENLFKEIFPITETPIIFITYVTSEVHLADYLAGLLRKRVKSKATVFVAKGSIPSGKHPLQTMFDQHLLKAKCLIPICSEASKESNWLWWETSAVWAKGGLVCPLFANISANQFGEPIKSLFQGNDFFKADDLEKMMKDAFGVLGIEAKEISLSPEEIKELNSLSRNSKCTVVVDKEIISEGSEKHLYSLELTVTNQESKEFEGLDITLIFPTISIQKKEWEYNHLRSKTLDRNYTELHFSFNSMPEAGIKQFRPDLLPGRTFSLFGTKGITRFHYIANDAVEEKANTLFVRWKIFGNGKLISEGEKPLNELIAY